MSSELTLQWVDQVLLPSVRESLRPHDGDTIIADDEEILWQRTGTYVSPDVTHIVLQIHFAHPCEVLRQFKIPHTDNREVEEYDGSCRNVFVDQIIHRIGAIGKVHATAPVVIMPQAQQ